MPKRIMQILAVLIGTLFVALPAIAQDGYRIRSGDTLNIEVLEDSALNRSTIVLPDGRISFPFAGTIRAAGKTIGQVQSAISSGISSNFALPPNVFVSVVPADRPEPVPVVEEEPLPETVNIYLLGEIASPGPKELLEGTTILQALSASGGFTNFAAKKRVQLRRTNPRTGLQSVFNIDYSALERGAELQNDVPLQEGDVILVPERRLFE